MELGVGEGGYGAFEFAAVDDSCDEVASGGLGVDGFSLGVGEGAVEDPIVANSGSTPWVVANEGDDVECRVFCGNSVERVTDASTVRWVH